MDLFCCRSAIVDNQALHLVECGNPADGGFGLCGREFWAFPWSARSGFNYRRSEQYQPSWRPQAAAREADTRRARSAMSSGNGGPGPQVGLLTASSGARTETTGDTPRDDDQGTARRQQQGGGCQAGQQGRNGVTRMTPGREQGAQSARLQKAITLHPWRSIATSCCRPSNEQAAPTMPLRASADGLSVLGAAETPQLMPRSGERASAAGRSRIAHSDAIGALPTWLGRQ
jgi:hypothetical protein